MFRVLSSFALLVFAFVFSVHAAKPPHGWGPNPFAPLSAERIAALPADRRPAWQAYWEASEKLAAQLPVRQAPDASSLKPMSTPPKGGIHTKGLRLGGPAAWYATEEARTIADRVVAAQLSFGAWTKGMDYTRSAGPKSDPLTWTSGTFDNDATIFELRFLARVISSAPGESRAAAWRGAFERGLRYIFAAQYPNGGFPQIYPLIGGYHDGVTFNDDAMAHVLELLRDVAAQAGDYAFVPAALSAEAAARLDRGTTCVLATQLRNSSGERTVWCQQYDPLTLQPSAARNFEPVADCSRESATLVLFLMSLPRPSAEIVSAVEGAVAWFRATALHDLRVRRAPADTRGEAVPSPGAPPLWARFYEPGTTTPIFGDRDRTIHYDLSEISSERIAGYSWYTDLPNRVLDAFETWPARSTR
jgi:PelA/Pel-15E family pectate lyase